MCLWRAPTAAPTTSYRPQQPVAVSPCAVVFESDRLDGGIVAAGMPKSSLARAVVHLDEILAAADAGRAPKISLYLAEEDRELIWCFGQWCERNLHDVPKSWQPPSPPDDAKWVKYPPGFTAAEMVGQHRQFAVNLRNDGGRVRELTVHLGPAAALHQVMYRELVADLPADADAKSSMRVYLNSGGGGVSSVNRRLKHHFRKPDGSGRSVQQAMNTALKKPYDAEPAVLPVVDDLALTTPIVCGCAGFDFADEDVRVSGIHACYFQPTEWAKTQRFLDLLLLAGNASRHEDPRLHLYLATEDVKDEEERRRLQMFVEWCDSRGLELPADWPQIEVSKMDDEPAEKKEDVTAEETKKSYVKECVVELKGKTHVKEMRVKLFPSKTALSRLLLSDIVAAERADGVGVLHLACCPDVGAGHVTIRQAFAELKRRRALTWVPAVAPWQASDSNVADRPAEPVSKAFVPPPPVVAATRPVVFNDYKVRVDGVFAVVPPTDVWKEIRFLDELVAAAEMQAERQKPNGVSVNLYLMGRKAFEVGQEWCKRRLGHPLPSEWEYAEWWLPRGIKEGKKIAEAIDEVFEGKNVR